MFVLARIYFCDGRTDTLRENNDHLFGLGLVGQQSLFDSILCIMFLSRCDKI